MKLRFHLSIFVHDMKVPPLLLLLLSALVAACTDQPQLTGSFSPAVNLLLESHQVPYTANHSIVLRSDHSACMIDSFRLTVLCGNREWRSVTQIGAGVGDGPGEFRNPAALVRGGGGRLGVVDWRAKRLTLFSGAGEVRRQLDLRGAPGDPNERADIAAAAEAPDGTIVTWTGEAALHRFDSAGAYLGDLRLPEYREERRNTRDMVERSETYRAVFKTEPPAEVLREQAAKPKPALVPGEPLKYDSRGRLWVLTSRDHDEFSYFEVFDGERHVGRARARPRAWLRRAKHHARRI